ncbi:MAG: GntR family transcriptional regulator [Aquabacterium sp.]
MSAVRNTPRKPSRLSKVDANALAASAESPPSPSTRAPTGDADHSPTALIVQAITQAIVEHRLQPGTKLVEQTIGDRFGVSRTIVRQALFKLEQMKLVTQEPARGTFVAQPSVQEAREVFAVRRMIEGQMIRDLTPRLKAADLQKLKAHIRQEKQAVQRLDVAARTRLLFDFHVLLAQLTGNQVLVALMTELVSRCSLIGLMYQSASDAATSHHEHADIMQALEARDADRAAQLMADHLQVVEAQLTEHRRTPL